MNEMRILLMNGREVHFTKRELQRFLWSRNLLVLLVIALTIITTINPIHFEIAPELHSRMFYWGTMSVLLVALIPYVADVMFGLWRRVFDRPMPHFFVTTSLIIFVSWLGSTIPQVMGDIVPIRETATLKSYIRNIFIGETLVAIALLWLMPLDAIGKRQNKDDSPPPPSPKFVHIGNISEPLNNLLYVRSSGHYLIVTTHDGTTEHLHRMKDFLTQLPNEAGISPHRSHWVAKSVILRLNGQKLKTTLGEDIPVARGRQQAVSDWLRDQGLPHKA